MEKVYVKPEVECVEFKAEEIMNDFNGGNAGTMELPSGEYDLE